MWLDRTRLFFSNTAPVVGAPAGGVSYSRALANRNASSTVDAQPIGSLVRDMTQPTSGSRHVNTTGSEGFQTCFFGAFASGALAAQRIRAGTWTISIHGGKEAVLSASTTACLYLWNPTTGAVRTYLRDSADPMGSGFSINDSMQVFTINGRAADVVTGDLLVVELWLEYWGGVNPFGVGYNIHFGGLAENGGSVGVFGTGWMDAPSALQFSDDVVPIFNFDVDWANPLTTTRSYATRIIAGRTGNEQRLALRESPDLLLAFKCLAIDAQEAQTLDRLVESGLARYMIPWWPDMVLLDAAVTPGQTVLPVDTPGRAYVDGGEAVLWNRPWSYERVTIASHTDTDITATVGVTNGWGVNTVLMPLLPGWLVKAVSTTRLTRDASSADVEFNMDVVHPT